jgi:hypothetical protein
MIQGNASDFNPFGRKCGPSKLLDGKVLAALAGDNGIGVPAELSNAVNRVVHCGVFLVHIFGAGGILS